LAFFTIPDPDVHECFSDHLAEHDDGRVSRVRWLFDSISLRVSLLESIWFRDFQLATMPRALRKFTYDLVRPFKI
jgi:hypothetical protein